MTSVMDRRCGEAERRKVVGGAAVLRTVLYGLCSTLIALAAALATGCVPSVPLQGPGDETANVFVHPITGKVVHCETVGLPYQVRDAILWRRSLTPDCATAAEEQGVVQQ